MKKLLVVTGILAVIAFAAACKHTVSPPSMEGDLLGIPYSPQAYTIAKPMHYPEVPVPASNPMTFDGVQLGRHLFYDPILSADSTMSCSSCHLPAHSFTDAKQVSTGIDGIAGKRSSMSLMNIAYVVPKSPADSLILFWDGRAKTLEDQALLPVEDAIELHNLWPNVIEKLKAHPTYPAMFREAFGIADRSEITKELAAKALAQFERILIGSGNSDYDRFMKGDLSALQDEAFDGFKIFNDEGAPFGLPDGECFHCHGTGTLTGNGFFNNGLDPYDLITDIGRQAVTTNPKDRGKFRAPTMMNIELSAPYMHDGRFSNLNQLVDHYLFDAQPSPGMDVNLGLLINRRPFYNSYHREALVAFLKSLTDMDFINNPDIQSPF